MRQEGKRLLRDPFWQLELLASGWEEGGTKPQGGDKHPLSPKPESAGVWGGESSVGNKAEQGLLWGTEW